MSCVGVMFVPHHQRTADELIRVCRTGGTIGLVNWTPAGFVGQLFATMKPFLHNYGPTIVAYRGAGADPERVAEIDQALVDLGRRFVGPDGTWEWEYLLWTARKV